MITLDENHVYHDETGAVIPGVTSILRDAGLIDATWFDDYSRDRGTLVHQACALYDRDDLDMDSLAPVLEPFVRAWINFRKDTGFVPEAVEEKVSHPIHRYAGKLDARGKLWKDNAIIDRKTGSAQSWAALQLAAYEACLPERHRRFVVELDSEGKYRLIEYRDRNDIKVFLAALAIVNWRKNKGVK